MASQVTVSPSLGHGLVTAQSAAPAGYDAIDDRRFWGAGLQEGALSEGAFLVDQSSPAAMTVEVAANDPAGALVKGDAVTAQGLYYIPPHSADITLDVAAADPTLPRIDSVILEVKDDTHDSSGLNEARVRIITGTPTGGATLNNRSGAPTVPTSALHLADVWVPNGASSISTSDIRDKRTMARGAYCYFEDTSSETWGVAGNQIGALHLFQELSAEAAVEVGVSGIPFQNNSGTEQYPRIILKVDGTTVAESHAYVGPTATGIVTVPPILYTFRPLIRRRYEFQVCFNGGNGGGNTAPFSTSRPGVLRVRELVGVESWSQ